MRSSLTTTSVTLLGPATEHRDSLGEMLGCQPSRLNWLPDSLSFRRSQGAAAQHRFVRLMDQISGTRDRAYIDYVINAMADFGTRLVIAYWGTLPLADLAAIKKALPDAVLVLMVLCYPVALTREGIYRQNFYMRRTRRFLDAYLCPSEEMCSYIRDRVIRDQAVPSLVLPPCWPASFQAAVRPKPMETVPNIVYAGRTDLASPTIHAGDDIRNLMRNLLESGIELHHVYSPATDDGDPRRKLFDPIPLRSLIEFMGRFDASLVAYNTDACARADRFHLSVPDRLITSVAAGVPIAIPKRGYSAAKSHLKDYPAVIEFESPSDLAQTLADRPRISDLRDAAWNSRQYYAASQHGADLRRFLERLL